MSERRPYIRAGRLVYKSGRVIYLIRPAPVRHRLLRAPLLPTLIGITLLAAALLTAMLVWRLAAAGLLLRLIPFP